LYSLHCIAGRSSVPNKEACRAVVWQCLLY